MKRNIVILLLLFTLTIVISCVPTLYNLEDRTGGYGETQIDKNVWKVYFSFNRHTTDERALNYLRLRCAELTIHNEFQYFQISDLETNPKQTLTKSGEDFYSSKQQSKSCVIACFKDKPEKGTSYNATEIIKSIKDKYNTP